MANKISLANKYRPKEFSDVVEQDSIKTILLNQMQTDNLKHAYLFCGSAGTGKAQPLDSLILTPAGYVKMEDIKIGDKVIDGLGNETIVIDIFPQGIKPIYQVIFSDGASVLCSDEHLWKVQIDNTWYIKDTMSIKNNLYNTKYNVPLPDLTKYENIIDKTLFEKYYNLDEKYIVDIVYLKQDYCQCILVESDDHTYITDDLTVTHNTTSARIIANMMNEGKGRVIELDCASHNGVDDMRNIIEECKSKPIQGKYKIFLLDEVHMLTVQAWNSLLKILEEPPEFVIFLFCTTEPQKIIGTVLSRVQRFNFQRISVSGIYNRLKYIIENENKERQFKQENIITYENEALKYIARLAKGGMRDSITTLEKCLDYNINLTLDNVLKVTSGSITENDMMKLTDCILQKDAKSALILFNDIYNSGIDITLFMKMYIEFIENCNKLLITSVIELTTLSDIAVNWLRDRVQYKNIFSMLLLDAGQMRLNYTADDMKIIIESWLMKVCNW